jgi:predicted aspartyl protease
MKFPIKRDAENGVFLVSITLDKNQPMNVLLDTGASTSTFDFTSMVMAGYDLRNPLDTAQIETGNGVVQVEIFEIREITAFGIVRKHFPIQVYDFLTHGILSEYQGILGIDFFEGTKFCIDTVENILSIEPKTVC